MGNENENRKVVAYLRISRDAEGQSHGVTRQREDCEELARRHAFEDVEYIEENDMSASRFSKKPRPLYDAMMARIGHGEISTVLAYSTSRLTRRPRELEDLIEAAETHGVRFITMVSGDFDLSTSGGQDQARYAANRDAGESKVISERVKRAARQRSERGEYHGGMRPPLGYLLKRDETTGKNKPVIDPQRAPLVRDAIERLLNGDTLYGICSDWNRRGITTNTGAHWRSVTLRSALLSPSLVGQTSARVQGWEPLVSEVDWERVGRLLRDDSRKFPVAETGYTGKRAMGGGLTVCGLCGKKLISQKYKSHVRLICHSQAMGGCGKVTIDHDQLEEYVTARVFAALESDETTKLLGTPADTAEERDLRQRLRDLRNERSRAYNAMVKGWVEEAEFDHQRQRIDAEVIAVETRLTELASAGIVGSLDEIRDGWDQRPPLARRAVLQSVVRVVRVQPHPKGVATTLTPFKDECDTCLQRRRRRHREATLDQRVQIEWRV
ncbi:recombinase family protein [Calidifontibacter terrae]